MPEAQSSKYSELTIHLWNRPPLDLPLLRSHGKIKLSAKTVYVRESHIEADTFGYQTSIGTGYDLSNSVFSPDGRNFQVYKN